MRKNGVVFEELIDLVAELIGQRFNKGDIKRVIYEVNGGKCGRATVEKILTLAREKVRAAAHIDANDHLAESIEFYKSIIRDESVTVQARMEANAKLDELLGIGAKWSSRGDTNKNNAKKTVEALRQMKEATDVERCAESEEAEDAEAST